MSQAGECRAVAQTFWEALSLFCQPQTECCAFLQASEACFLSPTRERAYLPTRERASWGAGTFPFSPPSQGHRSQPTSFFSFFFHPTQLRWRNFSGSFLLSEVFCQRSVGILWELFAVFVGGGELHVLLLCRLDCTPFKNLFYWSIVDLHLLC